MRGVGGAISFAVTAILCAACVGPAPTVSGIDDGDAGATDGAPSNGTDAQSSNDGGTADAGATTDAGTATDTGTTNNDSGGSVSCGSAPSIHQEPGGSIYCSTLTCTTGNECCLGGPADGGYAPNACVPFGQACTNPPGGGIQVECQQTPDCAANGMATAICCLPGASLNPACSFPFVQGGHAACEVPTGGACAAGELQLCHQTSECAGGKTCVAGRWKAFQVGVCQ